MAIDGSSPCPVVLWFTEFPSMAFRVAPEVIGPDADKLETRIFEGHTIFLRRQNEQAAAQ